MHREKTGEGSWVGTSLYANGLWSNGVFAQGALVGSFLAPRPPRDRPRSALGNIYRTRDDRWLQLTIVREDKLWAPLCRALEVPELAADPRFAEITERRANSKELVTIFDGVFLQRDYEDWLARLAAENITFGVIGRVQDLATDDQAVHAGAIIDADVPDAPRQINNPIRLSFARTRTPKPAPSLGEHGETILREAGMDSNAIAALKSSKGLL
jgi:formyl-CoA transferase